MKHGFVMLHVKIPQPVKKIAVAFGAMISLKYVFKIVIVYSQPRVTELT